MAGPRLPFLWPMLFRPAASPQARASIPKKNAALRSRCPRRSSRQLSTTSRAHEAPITQRYGAAYEHKPAIGEKFVPATDDNKGPAPSKASPQTAQKPVEAPTQDDPEAEEDEDHTPSTTPTIPSKVTVPAEESAPPVPTSDPPRIADAKPVDSVLHMPSAQQEEEKKPPHLKTPPYVHHFDTYGLVRELNKSTYSSEQSITIMKAVRQILLDNMALARAGLVSKSSVENETYLFRAACSELKTEIGNARKGQIERMRTERNQLQHEVDILGQRLGQETGNLKDELKGLFDDRKMAVRQEQRSMETKIQELNYKITVALNSDARSEVEGLRWVLTRRAAITVGVSAFMLFVALRYTSYIAHQTADAKKNQNQRPPPPSPLEMLAESNTPRAHGVDAASPMGLGAQEALGGELLATEGVSLG